MMIRPLPPFLPPFPPLAPFGDVELDMAVVTVVVNEIDHRGGHTVVQVENRLRTRSCR